MKIRRSIFLLINVVTAVYAVVPLVFGSARESSVVVLEDERSFTLGNGVVTATVSKMTGDLASLRYKDAEMLNVQSGRPVGYWSHNVVGSRRSTTVTIDPKANGGERAEISIKGFYNGVMLGSGPGGGVSADIEIRYAIERGAPVIYTYSVFSHATNFQATSVGEARFCAKLNDELFDWMTVDANRNLKMLTA
ncbi:MAG TPA: hypothetical protein VJA21_29115, partial [Verrucomicrobiae bacterium]